MEVKNEVRAYRKPICEKCKVIKRKDHQNYLMRTQAQQRQLSSSSDLINWKKAIYPVASKTAGSGLLLRSA